MHVILTFIVLFSFTSLARADVRNPLLKGLEAHHSVKKEHYIKGQLAFLKFIGRTQASIDLLDYHFYLEKTLQNRQDRIDDKKSPQVDTLLSYDSNHDRTITFEELENNVDSSCLMISWSSFNTTRSECSEVMNTEFKSNRIKEILEKHDLDHNGLIEEREIIEAIQRIYAQRIPDYDQQTYIQYLDDITQYIKLDPNGDGKLAFDELMILAENTFSQFDVNNDDIFSREEAKSLPKAGSYDNFKYRHHCGYNDEGKRVCLRAPKAYDSLNAKPPVEENNVEDLK